MRSALVAIVTLLALPVAAPGQTRDAREGGLDGRAAEGVASSGSAPRPASGRLTLRAERIHKLGQKRVVLNDEVFRVRAIVRPFVPGQKVLIRITRGNRVAKAAVRELRRIKGTNYGSAAVLYRPGRTGRVWLRAAHGATAAQKRMEALPIPVTVLATRAGGGASGMHVRFLQQRLSRLGYAAPITGYYGGATQRAVLAFRKVNGMRRVTNATPRIFFRAASGRGAFRPRYPGHGRHVEADLSRQVLALVYPGGKVYRVFHTSSGKASTPTILGSFRFYRKDAGTNSHGMVHSSYFIRGYAIHGYASVPTHPASHGCLRVPIPNARFIFDWVRFGERIDVYP